MSDDFEWPNQTLEVKWGGDRGPYFMPQIGERVRLKINNLGTGVVFGFFVEHGFLGVKVELDDPPEWFWKQNGHHIAYVFAPEIQEET